MAQYLIEVWDEYHIIFRNCKGFQRLKTNKKLRKKAHFVGLSLHNVLIWWKKDQISACKFQFSFFSSAAFFLTYSVPTHHRSFKFVFLGKYILNVENWVLIELIFILKLLGTFALTDRVFFNTNLPISCEFASCEFRQRHLTALKLKLRKRLSEKQNMDLVGIGLCSLLKYSSIIMTTKSCHFYWVQWEWQTAPPMINRCANRIAQVWVGLYLSYVVFPYS